MVESGTVIQEFVSTLIICVKEGFGQNPKKNKNESVFELCTAAAAAEENLYSNRCNVSP
jgi:hypothetical protein